MITDHVRSKVGPADAKAVAEWLVSNHQGKVLSLDDDALLADIANVLSDFRAKQSPVVGMTRLQAKLLTFYRQYQASNGHTPCYREAAEALSITKSRVCYLLHQLQDRGLVSLAAGRARAVTILARA